MTDWIKELKAGVAPEQDTDGWKQLVRWFFMGQAVDGLPDARSAEASALVNALPASTWEVHREQ